MECQIESPGSPRNCVDLQIQGTSRSQISFSEWLDGQISTDTPEQSVPSSKRDWRYERGESSKRKRKSFALNQGRVSNNINGNSTRNSQCDSVFNPSVPCIELDDSDDNGEEECIDLTDRQDTAGGSSVNYESRGSNVEHCVDVISLCSDQDVLSDELTILDPNDFPDNNDEDRFIVLDAISITDNESEIEEAQRETDNTLDMTDGAFTSMLSTIGIPDDFYSGGIVITSDTETETDFIINNGIHEENIHNMMLSTMSIIDIPKYEVEQQQPAGTTRKRKRKTKKKKKTNASRPRPPPHVIRRIIQEKRERKFQKKFSRQDTEDKTKLGIKKGDYKVECKVDNVTENISPAVTETNSVGRTLATQTVDVFRIAIKDEVDYIKEEN